MTVDGAAPVTGMLPRWAQGQRTTQSASAEEAIAEAFTARAAAEAALQERHRTEEATDEAVNHMTEATAATRAATQGRDRALSESKAKLGVARSQMDFLQTGVADSTRAERGHDPLQTRADVRPAARRTFRGIPA